eukprot:Polyplicarium_translucidae@DN1437_c0_g1_i2.p1
MQSMLGECVHRLYGELDRMRHRGPNDVPPPHTARQRGCSIIDVALVEALKSAPDTWNAPLEECVRNIAKHAKGNLLACLRRSFEDFTASSDLLWPRLRASRNHYTGEEGDHTAQGLVLAALEGFVRRLVERRLADCRTDTQRLLAAETRTLRTAVERLNVNKAADRTILFTMQKDSLKRLRSRVQRSVLCNFGIEATLVMPKTQEALTVADQRFHFLEAVSRQLAERPTFSHGPRPANTCGPTHQSETNHGFLIDACGGADVGSSFEEQSLRQRHGSVVRCIGILQSMTQRAIASCSLHPTLVFGPPVGTELGRRAGRRRRAPPRTDGEERRISATTRAGQASAARRFDLSIGDATTDGSLSPPQGTPRRGSGPRGPNLIAARSSVPQPVGGSLTRAGTALAQFNRLSLGCAGRTPAAEATIPAGRAPAQSASESAAETKALLFGVGAGALLASQLSHFRG